MSSSLRPHGLCSPWNSSGQDTGVGSLSLLQGIFPTQRSNRGLLHCRQILYQLSHKGSPTILEWVAYPFSRGSSRPRNRTRVSCTAGRFFTNWVISHLHFCPQLVATALWGVGWDGECAFPYSHHVSCDLIWPGKHEPYATSKQQL